jgi:hypothetical protein
MVKVGLKAQGPVPEANKVLWALLRSLAVFPSRLRLSVRWEVSFFWVCLNLGPPAKSWASSFFLAGWALAPLVWAEESTTAPQLEEVRVLGRAPSQEGSFSDESASQGLVLQQELQNRALFRPGEVLETVPGMIVTQHSGGGQG